MEVRIAKPIRNKPSLRKMKRQWLWLNYRLEMTRLNKKNDKAKRLVKRMNELSTFIKIEVVNEYQVREKKAPYDYED